LAIFLLIANANEKSDVCRFGIKWKKKKERKRKKSFLIES
jgi:hypothetical protein